MKDRTRRYESGKMLLDVAKYFATVTGIGTLASERANRKVIAIGLIMALASWAFGFVIIPRDREER